MTTNDNEKLVKTSKIFYCEMCDYSTCRHFNLQLHFNSIKHKNNEKTTKLVETSNAYKCENCNKSHKDRAGLWRHKKSCTSKKDNDTLILTLVNQNAELLKETSEVKTLLVAQTLQTAELQTQVLEMLKNGTNNTINNNVSFNLQFYLNDTCKDAMNLVDFSDSIKWQIPELEMVGRMGFIKGVSKLIIDKSNSLEAHKRPMHCTDAKREVFYVKNNDKWERECDGNPALHRVVKHVSRMGLILPIMAEFRDKNPEYNMYESDVSTKYQRIMSETLCGNISDDEYTELEKENIIIKNISKEVLINKRKIA
jgi:hypothetical protein